VLVVKITTYKEERRYLNRVRGQGSGVTVLVVKITTYNEERRYLI